MRSCTVIISHYESLPFLRACVRQIKRYQHPEVRVKIIICDQSKEETHNEILSEYHDFDADLRVVHTAPLYSGYGVDYLIHNGYIDTDYIVQLHVDAFPIHKNWLYMPINLIEEYDLAFAGQLQFISTGKESIYPPSPMFAMAQCFNVAKTAIYKEMSLEAGFTRFHNRPQSGLTWNNNDWADWAAADYSARGSDDDVVAFHWEDKYREHNKLGLAISGYIQPQFGRLIDDIVFHFGSANEARTLLDHMPEQYREYVKKINENYSDELISEMVTLAKANKAPETEILSRNFWDGKYKVSTPLGKEISDRIEQLKNL